MTLFTFEHFWSNIVRSTANGPLALTIKLQFGSQTEIANFDLHLVVKEEVTEFEISVDDSVTMEVLDGQANLVDIALHLQLV